MCFSPRNTKHKYECLVFTLFMHDCAMYSNIIPLPSRILQLVTISGAQLPYTALRCKVTFKLRSGAHTYSHINAASPKYASLTIKTSFRGHLVNALPMLLKFHLEVDRIFPGVTFFKAATYLKFATTIRRRTARYQ